MTRKSTHHFDWCALITILIGARTLARTSSTHHILIGAHRSARTLAHTLHSPYFDLVRSLVLPPLTIFWLVRINLHHILIGAHQSPFWLVLVRSLVLPPLTCTYFLHVHSESHLRSWSGSGLFVCTYPNKEIELILQVRNNWINSSGQIKQLN